MLVIRAEQMQALDASVENPFIDLVVEHLELFHEEAIANLPAAELRRRVIIGLSRARSHDIDQQDLLTVFVALMFVIAPNFDQQPAIRMALRRGAGAEDNRGQRLAEVPQEHWLEAARFSDARAWSSGA